MSPSGLARALIAPALVVGLALAPTAHAASRTLPSKDAFYTYTGSTPLSHIAPGTWLKYRPMALSFGTNHTPVRGTQLLYRTTTQLGEPSVTVTTVLVPTRQPVITKLVGYLSFYDGLGSKCDPSFTLAGGNGGPAITQQSEEEASLISWYLSQGMTVTVPDFEGTALHWMAGRESGYGTLDAIKATESFLHVGAGTPVGLSGFSGGAVAGDWANELVSSYAPTVNLVGVALGGIPVDYAHLFAYVNGDASNSSTMPGILLGLARAYHLDLSPYLSSYGMSLVRAEDDVCITSEFGRWPHLTYQQLLKPQYQDIFKVPAFIRLFNEQLMGTAPGRPRAPMLMGNGNADGIGDGVMRADDVRSLAREYCGQGQRVLYNQYKGAAHAYSGAFFEPSTGPFLVDRLNGVLFRGNCPYIRPGNSIEPLPAPSA
jgi:hypothetical protein